jgi:SAM-dependent methyltransferase
VHPEGGAELGRRVTPAHEPQLAVEADRGGIRDHVDARGPLRSCAQHHVLDQRASDALAHAGGLDEEPVELARGAAHREDHREAGDQSVDHRDTRSMLAHVRRRQVNRLGVRGEGLAVVRRDNRSPQLQRLELGDLGQERVANLEPSEHGEPHYRPMNPEEWRAAMRAWALPDAILAAAPESPWALPIEPFRTRVERAAPGDLTFSNRRARDGLPLGGTVLDVGVGAGAASLPLRPRCALVIGVDSATESLSAFRGVARGFGVNVRTIKGIWPDVERRTPVADVVVANHVVYNVGDLGPFALALTAHARRRVVIEMTSRHPTAWTADLWMHFHGLERPSRPTATDAVSLLRGLGLPVHRHAAIQVRGAGGFRRREDAVAWIRRRLCLDSSRDPEVVSVLGDRLAFEDGLWSVRGPVEPVVTAWWDVTGD